LECQLAHVVAKTCRKLFFCDGVFDASPPAASFDQHAGTLDARDKAQNPGSGNLSERSFMRPLGRGNAHRVPRGLADPTRQVHTNGGILKAEVESGGYALWKCRSVESHAFPPHLDNPTGYPHSHNDCCC